MKNEDSLQPKEMLYIKHDRIILVLDQTEYDVTDHLTELVDELANLKSR
ncbi:hypothetical protein QQY92_00565 [Streptococcus suis]|nr:hypothetical protein [Streptococcus suis]